MSKSLFIILIITLLATCTFAGNCTWAFGSTKYDFSDLPIITGKYGNQPAYFSLCTTISQCTEGPSMICSPGTGGIGSKDISLAGLQTATPTPTTTYDATTKTNQITFNNGLKTCGGAARSTVVSITCAEAASTTFTVVDGAAACSHTIAISLPCKGGDAGGLSGVLAGYFLFGILICKFALKKEGLDVIPQRAFWCCLIPAYVAGIKCVIGKITGKKGGSNSSSSDGYGATEEV